MSKIANTYQGSPCKKYDHTERYVSTGTCIACTKAHDEKRYAENPEKYFLYSIKYRTENREKYLAQRKKRYAENNGKEKGRYRRALYRATIKQQTPLWSDKEKIKEIYMNCPKGYEVDHKHPLSKGGLHVYWNLQYLTIHDNRSKGDKIL